MRATQGGAAARRGVALAFAFAALAGALAFGLLLRAGPGAADESAPLAVAATTSATLAAGDLGAELALVEPAAPSVLDRPAAAAPAVVSDDLPQSPRAHVEGSEAALYERFLELGRRGDGSLSAEAERRLGAAAPAPVNERVALLRALWDSGAPDASRWFVSAIDAPDEGARAEAAVPDFAVRFLAERAARDPAAARALADAVAAAPQGCDAARLARAAAASSGAPGVEPP